MVFNKINIKFIFLLLFLTFFNYSYSAVAKDFVVVIDAGHGGHDGGAHGPHGNEKDVTLAVSLKLGKLLEKESNIKVIYTRTTDVFIELGKRAQIANDAKADLFISIHCNSAHAGAAGTESWVLGTEDSRQESNFSVVQRENSVIYLEDDYEKTYDGFDPNSPEDIIAMTLIQDSHYENSVFIAQKVEEEFKKDKRTSRGVKQSGFAVLWKTAMPATLIEIGFISNPTEGKYICSDNGQNEIAHSISAAFKQYKDMWDKKNNNTVKVAEKPKEPEKGVAGTHYLVQFLASKSFYKEGDTQLRGLKNVLVIKDNDFYKYYYGITSLNSEKENNLKQAKKVGFSTSFISVFLDKDKKTYALELFSTNKKYNTTHEVFKKVKNVSREKNSGVNKYKYIANPTQNFSEILKALEEAKKNGFPNAIIVMN